MRLIPDGTVLRDQLDRRATSISLLVAIGARADGEKVLLAIRSMGGKVRWLGARCSATWLRGLQTPELLIVDGAPALEKALAALWPAVPLQRY